MASRGAGQTEETTQGNGAHSDQWAIKAASQKRQPLRDVQGGRANSPGLWALKQDLLAGARTWEEGLWLKSRECRGGGEGGVGVVAAGSRRPGATASGKCVSPAGGFAGLCHGYPRGWGGAVAVSRVRNKGSLNYEKMSDKNVNVLMVLIQKEFL